MGIEAIKDRHVIKVKSLNSKTKRPHRRAPYLPSTGLLKFDIPYPKWDRPIGTRVPKRAQGANPLFLQAEGVHQVRGKDRGLERDGLGLPYSLLRTARHHRTEGSWASGEVLSEEIDCLHGRLARKIIAQQATDVSGEYLGRYDQKEAVDVVCVLVYEPLR